jgi:cytochrome c5
MGMAEHDEHSSFIKTPQQLITIVLLAFVVPIVGIVLMVQLVLNRPHADPAALTPEAIGARIQPVGKVEFGEPGGAAGGAPRSGEEIVKTVCGACHVSGVAGAPRIGDKAAWAPKIKEGLNRLLADAIKGITIKGALVMPPRGGGADLSDYEVARAIVHMANQSGGSMKEPAAPAPAKPAAAANK